MKLEKELSVLVDTTYPKLHQILLEKGFLVKEKYNIDDIYMIPTSIDIFATPELELLQNCVLIRKVTEENHVERKLVYKYKKFASNGDILEQGKVQCKIENEKDAYLFMTFIHYKELINIHDSCIIYTNNHMELCIQLVNDKYIFIEYECHSNKDINEMIKELKSLDLPIRSDNYFVKKALLVFEDTYQR